MNPANPFLFWFDINWGWMLLKYNLRYMQKNLEVGCPACKCGMLPITSGLWTTDPSGCITCIARSIRGLCTTRKPTLLQLFWAPQHWITASTLTDWFSCLMGHRNLCSMCAVWCRPLWRKWFPSVPISAAFIKERKMGLNDFIQKLVSTPHICQQWVLWLKGYSVT